MQQEILTLIAAFAVCTFTIMRVSKKPNINTISYNISLTKLLSLLANRNIHKPYDILTFDQVYIHSCGFSINYLFPIQTMKEKTRLVYL